MKHGLPTLLCGIPLVMLALTAPAAAAAEETAADGPTVGLRLHVGGSLTGRADDRPGDITLLLGTGFTGTSWGAEVVGRWPLHRILTARAGVGLLAASGRGWVETDDTRRELTLSFVALELPLLLEVSHPALPQLELWGAAGLAPRVGVHATATELRTGFREDTNAPAIATNTSLLFLAEAGVATTFGSVRVPLGLRLAWNATYPSTTRQRLPEFATIDAPGPYRVDNDWTVLVTIGVDVGF
jgi:hypothetical protein